jgi:RNA polymerase sigma factor for flagellar operon FliA
MNMAKSHGGKQMKSAQHANIAEIWEKFLKDRSEKLRNILLEHYLPIVKYTADRIYTKLPDKVELDDLVSAGIFGLKDAVEAFDQARGVKFETYCTPRIRGSILDELRSMDWVPRLVRARAHQLEKAMHTLEVSLGRAPTDKEVASEMKIDMDEYYHLLRRGLFRSITNMPKAAVRRISAKLISSKTSEAKTLSLRRKNAI